MSKVGRYLRNPYATFDFLAMRGLLGWMPDEAYLKLLYRARAGKKLDLDRPRTFNEKLQWLKLHDHDTRYSELVDKYLVKGVVSEMLGSQVVVPTLGVWKEASQIDFACLPPQFVLKTNHDSGGIVICRDRSTFDSRRAIAFLDARLRRSYYRTTREWPYLNVPPLVFAEEYLADERPMHNDQSGARGIVDYKFYCFHGVPRFLYLSQGLDDSSTARREFLSLEWERLPFSRLGYVKFGRLPDRPNRFQEMIELARRLATDIPFVRVDLFEHNGTVLFSEMTFYPASGMTPFVPVSADARIGSLLDLGRVRVTA